ncbi:O-antigen ligase family protein [Roseateles oligotrophus]|uniref:O-antigen ligase family protein n=1 Tax=Roseateles oligotrophus TaxID=1769250 RepID=A0ABT2YJF0_9BURK|nr:O-antigen ligase family protein [Roseateles oligotrophus]MCV2370153.1 O-antigen ligase family protein [Roseateles oligotrophus]
MKFKLGFARPVVLGPNFNQGRKVRKPVSRFVIPALGILLALFFGLAAAVLPWQFLVGIAGLPLLLLIGLAFPLPIFAISLLLMFGLVPEFIMAALPLGGAALRPPELMLIFLFVVVGFKSLVQGVSLVAPLKQIKVLLFVLALGLFLGVLKGKFVSHNVLAMADARQFVGWLALPISIWFLSTKPEVLHKLVIGIAILSAVLMLAQLALGVQLIFGFRGAETLGTEFRDVTRSAIGGGLFFLAYAAYSLFLSACHSEKNRLIYLVGCILAIGGVVASFNRGVWAGFVLCALLLLVFKPKTRHGFLMPLVALLLMVSIGLAGLFVAKPRVADAMLSRVLSLQEEGKRGSSLGFRFEENSQAVEAIRKNPLLGVGMGGEYKHAYRQLGVGGGFDTENSYIHNGYLSLWLKLGLMGAIIPVALLYFVGKGFANVAKNRSTEVPVEHKLKCLSAVAAIALSFVSALTSPDWSTMGQLAAFSIFIAILIVPVKAGADVRA